MIRRNTWILLLVLGLLVGLSFYVRDQKTKQAASAAPTLGSETLFSATEGPPTDIKIESALGTSVEVARDQSGKWVLKAPTEAAADQAAAEAAATQISALRLLATVQLGADLIGLDKPAYTISIAYGAGQAHKLRVGSVTPVQTGYYVQLDGGSNQIVDKIGLDALLDLLTRPPYLATLTPVPSLPATPEPASATLLPSATTPSSPPPVAPTATP
jgi:hypothetical protein